MEVCQEGLPKFGLPSWCVEQEIDVFFVLQGILELIIIVFSMVILSRVIRGFKKWRNRKKPPKNIWIHPQNPY